MKPVLIGSSELRNVESISMKLHSDYEGDNVIPRRVYKITEAKSGTQVFPDFVFTSFFSFSPTKKFVLLIRDLNGNEAIYQLALLHNETGKLYDLHILSHGTSTIQELEWDSDYMFQYVAKILSREEVVPGVPKVKLSRISVSITKCTEHECEIDMSESD